MKAVCSALARSGGTSGGAANGSAMKNGSSANSSSALAFSSLAISRPVGTSGNSGRRVSRPNCSSGRNSLPSHSARWPARIDDSPITWPSTSPRCMAMKIGAAP